MNHQLKHVLGINKLLNLMHKYKDLTPVATVKEFLNELRIVPDVKISQEMVPLKGRLIVVSNHPFGFIDLLVILNFIYRYRTDVVIMGSKILNEIPQFEKLGIAVDNFKNKIAKTEYKKLKLAFEQEKCILIFPSGKVSRLTLNGIQDCRWSPGFLKLATKYQAPILPIYTKGRNSWFFYISSLFCESLGTLQLPREIFKGYGKNVKLIINKLYKAHLSPNPISLEKQSETIRSNLYDVAKNIQSLQSKKTILKLKKLYSYSKIQKELEQSELITKHTEDTSVFLVKYKTAPNVVKQIGILRQHAFRTIGAGNEGNTDFNKEDKYYNHIILWNQKKQAIVGGFRIMDPIKDLSQIGKLYSSQFTEFGPKFKAISHISLELNRSFIQPIFQNSLSLHYLFCGISKFIKKYHPNARYLFGWVSLGNNLPKEIVFQMIAFFRYYYGRSKEDEGYFFPNLPPVAITNAELELYQKFEKYSYKENYNNLKALARSMGIPLAPLFKIYTGLFENTNTDKNRTRGVKIIDFFVDSEFGTIDALMITDLQYLKKENFSYRIDVMNQSEQLA